MSTYEPDIQEPARAACATAQGGMDTGMLLSNAQWFVNVRWTITVAFMTAGFVSLWLPDRLRALGIEPPVACLWILAILLLVANATFALIVSRCSKDTPRTSLHSILWAQIVVDLTVVTILVHEAGSTITGISFVYLLHIALACIFLPRSHSFGVALLATALYLGCVASESIGLIPRHTVLIGWQYHSLSQTAMFSISVVVVWFVIWYFCSKLSASVQFRDQQLSVANARLFNANKETNRKVLQITHDLKAPFSGIQSNVEVLKLKLWNDVPESVREIIDRIDTRSRALSRRINDILILGSLREGDGDDETQSAHCTLSTVVANVLEDLGGLMSHRKVTVTSDIAPAEIRGPAATHRLVFANLLSNAITYSHEGATIEIDGIVHADSVRLSITDHGIGIADKELPHIFDEYFRSEEAARFNQASTGLGLAIVKEAARHLGIRIKVTSERGRGTVVDLRIPRYTDTCN